MRPTPLAIIVASLVVHVGVVALVDAVEPPPPRKPRPRVGFELVPRASIAIEPISVALLTPPAPRPPPPPPAAAASAPTRAPSARAPSAGATARTPTGPTDPSAGGGAIATGAASGPETTPGAIGMLSMRRPGRIDLSLGRVLEGVDLGGGAPPPPPTVPSGELAPTGGGTFRSDQPGFSVDIARDGRATFRDKPAASIRFALPRAGDLARGLEGWYADPGAAIRAAGPPGGQAEDRHTKLPETRTVPILSGGLELTDWVMRQGGVDPYASGKRDFLERTRDERTDLRVAEEQRRLAQTTTTVRAQARRIWKRGDLPAAERRAALFELWDDSVEAGDADEGDAVRAEAGAAARIAVIGFIRAHLPAGSADAFTPAELAALNQRRSSKAIFAPY